MKQMKGKNALMRFPFFICRGDEKTLPTSIPQRATTRPHISTARPPAKNRRIAPYLPAYATNGIKGG